MAFFLWHIHLFATRAEHFDSRSSYLFAHSYGQDILSFAEDSRTNSKNSLEELFPHHAQAFRSQDKPSMNQTIEIDRFLVDGKISFIFQLLSSGGIRTQDHLNSFIIMIKHLLEPIKIKSISNVIIINFTEELMILQADKPIYPSFALIRTV